MRRACAILATTVAVTITASPAAAARPEAGPVTAAAALSNNTALALPFTAGQSWILTGGPHGVVTGFDRPYAAIDLAPPGGQIGDVRAAGAGTVRRMCRDPQGKPYGGWLRIIHPNGYITDYYHLHHVAVADGARVSAGQILGRTGTDTCAGGSASAAHVHFSIRTGQGAVSWHWRAIGKWVFWEGAAYGGYALHGSTRINPGGALVNHGPLGTNQGIVDANGGTTVNRRTGPGTSHPIAGTLADGATITIACWRAGTTHTGRYGSTSTWNKLTDGTWLSDAFVYTGANTIGSNC